MFTAPPVRRTTTMDCTPPAFSAASSALALSGTLRPPRKPSSAVTMTVDLASLMRPASESGEKPPNTTEWAAPVRAREHRKRRLGDHRQIDGDAVALLDPLRLEHVGELADRGMQFLVRDPPVFVRIVAFPQDRDLIAALGEMPVDAIVRHVGDAVLVPFDRDAVQVERAVLDLAVGLEPIDAFADLAPEAVGILDRTRVHVPVFRRVDEGALLPLGRDFVKLFRPDIPLDAVHGRRRPKTFPQRHYAAPGRAPTRRPPLHFRCGVAAGRVGITGCRA